MSTPEALPTEAADDFWGMTLPPRASEAQGVYESVQRGGTIAEPMKSAPEAFPPVVVQMIAVGEETGGLDSMLSKIADFYEDEVAAAVKALTSIIEPIMIVLVGVIVISMYMPMFKVYDQIK